MVLWQPKGGQGLPAAPAAGALGAETGWYFSKPETGICSAPSLAVKPPLDRLLATFRDALACLGKKPLDVTVQSVHDPSSYPKLYQCSIDPRYLDWVLREHGSFLTHDPSASVMVIKPSPFSTVELALNKLIYITGEKLRKFKSICVQQGPRPSPTLQILSHVRSSIHASMEHMGQFRLFIDKLEAEIVQQTEEEDRPYAPF
ncbi:MAG: hypothetical protein WCV62_03000 [Candidatus Peribacteraceae bacterium]|jgi:hypothetical protein